MPDTQRLVANRYRLIRPLAEGGFGRVWEAHDELLRADVVVKEVRLPLAADPEEQAKRLMYAEREARNAARLRRHPGIVPVYDVVVEDSKPWIVMELVDGGSLEERLRRGPLPLPEAVKVADALLKALDAAHRADVIHRDVKPANVMLAADGRIMLTDFGIATHSADTRLTVDGSVIGSLEYIAPERLNGADSVPASDLFSLGVTLYRAVEGISPFLRDSRTGTLAAVVLEDPSPLRCAGTLAPLIHSLLAKAPEARPTIPEALALLHAPPSGTGEEKTLLDERASETVKPFEESGTGNEDPEESSKVYLRSLDRSSEPTPDSPVPGDAPSDQRDDRPSGSAGSPSGSIPAQRRSMSPAGIIATLAVAVAVVSLAVTAVVLGSASRRDADVAATATATVTATATAAPTSDQGVVGGSVSCTSGNLVVGVWVEAERGSGFAFIRLDSAGSSSYQYTLPSSETYTLHVGCGGTSKEWAVSVNDAPKVSGRQNSFICNDIRDQPRYGTCTTQ
ncbi:serine/threonine-protein kinase [Streptomyces netropsis]|uniref:serine/threonine-protein kinase n=1 Tax=Streptomyces netropsis TaxID=55404 RepID=UPI00378B51F1